jgi:hypothetical protein
MTRHDLRARHIFLLIYVFIIHTANTVTQRNVALRKQIVADKWVERPVPGNLCWNRPTSLITGGGGDDDDDAVYLTIISICKIRF